MDAFLLDKEECVHPEFSIRKIIAALFWICQSELFLRAWIEFVQIQIFLSVTSRLRGVFSVLSGNQTLLIFIKSCH